ncbi:MAG TPA: hypothetical protein VK781_10810 [Solirubrobacteraceae bacterium]|nr:hypothetical protein [Solirubrobacteraceae bacterium]
MNDRGEAVGVHGAEKGALFYALEATGGLGGPIEIGIPGNFASTKQSVAIGQRGRVAVGLLYRDDTVVPSREYKEHEGSGCCGRVALSSWQLGQQPPIAQVLSAKQSAKTGPDHQVFKVPSIVVGPSAITALWTREGPQEVENGPGEPPELNETQLEAAFGRFSEPLHVARVTTAPRRISLTHLSLAPNGDPVASWLEDGDKLLSVSGSHAGALHESKRVQRIPRLSEPAGFATQAGGDTVFAYFWDYPEGASRPQTCSRCSRTRLMMSARAGGAFGRPRQISFVNEAIEATLAGGHHFLIAVWAKSFHFAEEGHLYVRRGSVSGRFGAPQALGFGSHPQAFADSHGNSVIVYRRPAIHDQSTDEVVAVTAQPGHRFGPPRPLAPHLKGCELANGGEIDPQSIATSPAGYAVFYITCEEGAAQYLIRYTP